MDLIEFIYSYFAFELRGHFLLYPLEPSKLFVRQESVIPNTNDYIRLADKNNLWHIFFITCIENFVPKAGQNPSLVFLRHVGSKNLFVQGSDVSERKYSITNLSSDPFKCSRTIYEPMRYVFFYRYVIFSFHSS